MAARRHGQDITAARCLIHEAARRWMPRQRQHALSMAKCFSLGHGGAARPRTRPGLRGGSGYIRGFVVERLYRDVKVTQIYEGTNQIQRTIIAKELMKHGA
jgi:alkylation response protein AidB-like acyl-CoA dehydrogenase